MNTGRGQGQQAQEHQLEGRDKAPEQEQHSEYTLRHIEPITHGRHRARVLLPI